MKINWKLCKLSLFATATLGIADGAAQARLSRSHHNQRVNLKTASIGAIHGSAPRHGGGVQTNRTLQSIIDTWASRGELTHSQVGVEVVDIESGKELAGLNGHRRFTPASTAKIVVTSCAFEKLTPKFTYKTKFASRGEIINSHLHGDLLVQPSQDPTTSRDDIRRMVSALKEKGVKEIEGNLLLEDVQGGGERFTGEWLAEDWSQDWMPVSSSLVLDRNIGSPSLFAKPKPVVREMAGFDNAIEKTLVQSDLTVGWISYNPKEKNVEVFVQDETKPLMASRVVANPDAFNLALVEDALKSAGLKIDKRDLKDEQRGVPVVLAQHDSDALALIIRTCLHESDNLYAQQLLRTIGAQNDTKLHGTLEEVGLIKEKQWLASAGVPTDEVVLWDGCGLSRKDFVSPYALCCVLKHMASNSALSPYLSLLTTATIKPQGSFQFKTGAMDSVRGLTGLLQMPDGRKLALAIMVNGHSPSVRDLRTSLGILVSQLSQAKIDLSHPAAKPEETAQVDQSTLKEIVTDEKMEEKPPTAKKAER